MEEKLGTEPWAHVQPHKGAGGAATCAAPIPQPCTLCSPHTIDAASYFQQVGHKSLVYCPLLCCFNSS